MLNSETIIWAAILSGTGTIYCGSRHPTIRAAILEKEKTLAGSRAGFLTSSGRFVNREEAARLASDAGQRHMHTGRPIDPNCELRSEDLW